MPALRAETCSEALPGTDQADMPALRGVLGGHAGILQHCGMLEEDGLRAAGSQVPAAPGLPAPPGGSHAGGGSPWRAGHCSALAEVQTLGRLGRCSHSRSTVSGGQTRRRFGA